MQCKARTALLSICASLLQLSATQAAAEVQFKLTTETVGDSALHSPNLPDGSFAPEKEIPRYTGNKVSIQWKQSHLLTLETELSQFRFTSLRDRFALNGFSLLARRKLAASTAHKSNTLEFRVASNYADTIHKNSYTEAGDTVITSLTIDKPSDLFVQAGFTHQRAFSADSSWRVFSSIGHLSTRHRGLRGSATNNNCEYDFDFGTSGGEITQTTPCGDIFSFRRQYPDDSALEQDLGISPVKDIEYSAATLKAGGGFSINRNRWSIDIAAYHQQYFRSTIDQRITDDGNQSYDSNQVITTELTHRTTPRLSFSAKLEYNRRQFLDHVPVLYNSFTADSFQKNVVFLAIQARYNLH